MFPFDAPATASTLSMLMIRSATRMIRTTCHSPPAASTFSSSSPGVKQLHGDPCDQDPSDEFQERGRQQLGLKNIRAGPSGSDN